MELVTEEVRRAVRSEMARHSVNKRWSRLSFAERQLAVAPANAARRRMKVKTGGRKRRDPDVERLLALLN